MLLNALVLCLAPFVGILIGLLPAIGALMAMIAFFPLLSHTDPNVTIAFYAMMLTASQFSGSVSAIWFGLLGEIASAPILKERPYIVKHNLQMVALRNTAMGSAVAVVFSCIGLYVFFQFALFNPWILRTEVVLAITLLVFVFCLFWPSNRWYQNLGLIMGGFFIGKIGFDRMTQTDFLTFGNAYLYAGIPPICVILGVYAVPVLVQLLRSDEFLIGDYVPAKGTYRPEHDMFPVGASIRGTIIGFVTGLIPMVGTTVCSNISYYIEKKLRQTPIACISSAESANNAAVISVLIPLLLLGLPIQTSELVLYTLITENNWSTASVSMKSIAMLLGFILASTLVSYLICWTFVSSITDVLKQHFKAGLYIIIFAIVANIVYIGMQSDQVAYYLVCFVVSLIIGLWLIRHVDPIPGLMMFMLQDSMFEAFGRFVTLYE